MRCCLQPFPWIHTERQACAASEKCDRRRPVLVRKAGRNLENFLVDDLPNVVRHHHPHEPTLSLSDQIGKGYRDLTTARFHYERKEKVYLVGQTVGHI